MHQNAWNTPESWLFYVTVIRKAKWKETSKVNGEDSLMYGIQHLQYSNSLLNTGPSCLVDVTLT